MSSATSAQPVSPPVFKAQRPLAFHREFDFLLDCCATGSPIERAERIGEIRPLDWRLLIDLAEHHGVIPQVYLSLSGDVVVPNSLRQSHENNARQTLWLTRE